ncbi:MAG: hypothetical protein IJZ93_02055 [Clostridia bacterium]|nr:hypothetical protein [Clostridia bacterium]
MLGKCFGVISCISILYSFFVGTASNISEAIISSASKSVSLVISLMGSMALWNGILNVLKDCGVIKKLSNLLKPILKLVFPSSFKNDIATEEITACISANLLGISNAATPLALSAIKKMNERNPDKSSATADMIMLAVLGCSCFNFLPTTILAIRNAFSAEITYQLIVPIWICSGMCMILGILLCRILGKLYGKN